MKNKIDDIRRIFTKKMAQDIFDILTPENASGRSTKEKIDYLNLPEVQNADGSPVPFFSLGKPRSSVDSVESYNRIPSDRAQDATVYFLEEVLRLKELKLDKTSISEQKKKITATWPDRDEDEEVVKKQYFLTHDTTNLGMKHRLVITHTFFRIEECSRRPNVTKTRQSQKPKYQMLWIPVRVAEKSGSYTLVDHPVESILYNDKTKKATRIPPKPALKAEWSSAIEIGKQNIIAFASQLRYMCYLILFKGQEPIDALLESTNFKYFKIISDLLYDKTRQDPFGFKDVQRESIIEKIGAAVPDITKHEDKEAGLVSIKPSVFAGNFELLDSRFEPTELPNSFVSPSFRLDMLDKKSVDALLFLPKATLESYAATRFFRSISTKAINAKILPTTKDILDTPFKSLFFLPGSCEFSANYIESETITQGSKVRVEKRGLLKLGTFDTGEKSTKNKLGAFDFIMNSEVGSRNKVSFKLKPHKGYPSLAFEGFLFYGASPENISKDRFCIELTGISKQIPKGEILEKDQTRLWCNLFLDFAKALGSLYSDAEVVLAVDGAVSKTSTGFSGLTDDEFDLAVEKILFDKSKTIDNKNIITLKRDSRTSNQRKSHDDFEKLLEGLHMSEQVKDTVEMVTSTISHSILEDDPGLATAKTAENVVSTVINEILDNITEIVDASDEELQNLAEKIGNSMTAEFGQSIDKKEVAILLDSFTKTLEDIQNQKPYETLSDPKNLLNAVSNDIFVPSSDTSVAGDDDLLDTFNKVNEDRDAIIKQVRKIASDTLKKQKNEPNANANNNQKTTKKSQNQTKISQQSQALTASGQNSVSNKMTLEDLMRDAAENLEDAFGLTSPKTDSKGKKE